MTTVLVATADGCRVFSESGQAMLELPGESVNALAAEGPDHALAVIDGDTFRKFAVDELAVWTNVAKASKIEITD